MAKPSTPLRPGLDEKTLAHSHAASMGAPAHASHSAHDENPNLQHHFFSMDQQLEASILGMWVFLVTEVMFFGGLFMAYIVYRTMYPTAWVESSHELNVYLGGINTAVLIVSSFTMAMAVRSAQTGSRNGQIFNLIGTMILGSTFLVIKYFEYAAKFTHHLVPGPHFQAPAGLEAVGNQMQIFFALYFIMTGIHAAHMIIGIVLMAVILTMAWRGKFGPNYYTPVEVGGLYWHFVDIVWIFLFPLLYLLGFHGGPGA